MAAAAHADQKPNDGITQAEGPLTGGVTYSGTIANPNDVDTYVFYVSGQNQLDVYVANTDPSSASSCLDVSLGNADNSQLLADSGFNSLNAGSSDDFLYTTPTGVTRYYLEFSEESGCAATTHYSFSISPGPAVVTGPATRPPDPTGEPNENQSQAIVRCRGTSPAPARSRQSTTRWSHLTFTSSAAAEYYVHINEPGCTGASYQFVAQPASALAPSLIPPPPPPVRLTAASGLAAFVGWISGRYPGAPGYWTCPAGQIFGGSASCWVEIKVGRLFHSLTASASVKSRAIVLSYTSDQKWRRHRSRFSRRWARGSDSPGGHRSTRLTTTGPG
jgi:hypothetical protein